MSDAYPGDPFMTEEYFEKLDIRNSRFDLTPEIWENVFTPLVERDLPILNQIIEEFKNPGTNTNTEQQ